MKSFTAIFCLLLLCYWRLSSTFASEDAQNETECACDSPAIFSRETDEGTFKSPENAPCKYRGAKLLVWQRPCIWVIEEGTKNQGIRLQFDSYDLDDSMYLDLKYIHRERGVTEFFKRIEHVRDVASMPDISIGSGVGLMIQLVHRSDIDIGQFIARFRRFTIKEERCVLDPFYVEVGEQETTLSSPRDPIGFCQAIETYQMIVADNPSKSVQIKSDVKLGRGEMLRLFDKHHDQSALLFDSRLILRQIKKSIFVGPSEESLDFQRHSGVRKMLILFSSEGETDIATLAPMKTTVQQVDSPCVCPLSFSGAALTFSGPSGSMLSPGSPRYCHYMNCLYRIKVDSGSVIRLTFDHLNLPPGDFLLLYLPGNTKPALRWTNIIKRGFRLVLDHSEATIRFESHAPTSLPHPIYYGFTINYTAITRPADCSCPLSNPQIFSEHSGNISMSACGPLDCLYYIRHPNKELNLLKITINHMNIRSVYDALVFARQANNQWDKTARSLRLFRGKLRKYTFYLDTAHGSNTQVGFYGAKVIPDWDTIVVHFISNTTMNSTEETGFSLSYEWLSHNCSCGDLELEAPSNGRKRFFAPPWSPKPYCNNMHCIWTITAHNSSQAVVLRFLHLDMEHGPDKLVIRDVKARGRQTVMTGKRIAKGQGVIKSNSSSIQITLITDDSITGTGWTIMYNAECCVRNPVVPTISSDTKSSTDNGTGTIGDEKSIKIPSAQWSTWSSTGVRAELRELQKNQKTAWMVVSLLSVICSLLVVVLVALLIVVIWLRRKQDLSDSKVIYFSNRAYSGENFDGLQNTDI